MTTEKFKDIPHLPQVSLEIIRHTFQEEPDVHVIASIIEKDPTLTVRLFKTVNSTAYGLKVPVKDLQQVVSILGLDALRSTIVALTLGDYFTESIQGNELDTKSFCIHSLATGIIVKELAEALGIKESNQLYLLGLLHDLGTLALDALKDPDYRLVNDRLDDGLSLSEAELEVFGWDNQSAWKALARYWQFPGEIVKLFEGTVEGRETFSVEKLLKDSSRLADTLGYRFMDSGISSYLETVDVFSNLSEVQMREIGRAAKSQVEAMSVVLDLPAPDKEQVNSMLLKVTHQLSKANERNTRIAEELKFRICLHEELIQVLTGIFKTLDSNTLNFSVLESIMEGFRCNSAFILTRKTKEVFAGCMTSVSEVGEADVRDIRLRREDLPTVMQQCFQEARPIKVHTRFNEELTGLLGESNLGWLVPVYAKGQGVGMIGLGVPDADSYKFNSDDLGKTLSLVSGEIGLLLENARLYRKMQQEARFDSLTGIMNRHTILKVLSSEFARFKRRSYDLCVAIFDLDNFKLVNDSRGHQTGDNYLKKASQILKGGVREFDYIGRYGGDEFLGIFTDTDISDVHAIVERIRGSLRKFCREFGGEELGNRLSVSAGIAGAHKGMAAADELIKLADSALYKAKDMGRNQCVVYEYEKQPQTT